MSLDDDLKSAIDRGVLFQLRPDFDGDPIVRELFVAEEVYEILFPQEADTHALLNPRRATLARMQLNRFITGGRIRCAVSSFEKSAECYLSPISPSTTGVWAIRDRENPQVRFIGVFVSRDVFIVLFAPSREELGKAKEGVWEYYRSESLVFLNELLPNQQPILGGDPHDVCTNIILDTAS